MKDSRRLATTDSDPKERYAVGAFNFSTLPEMVGIVEGARMKHAPVILMASLGAVKYIGSLELIAECAKGLAKTYPGRLEGTGFHRLSGPGGRTDYERKKLAQALYLEAGTRRMVQGQPALLQETHSGCE